jgi:hypothetical protein
MDGSRGPPDQTQNFTEDPNGPGCGDGPSARVWTGLLAGLWGSPDRTWLDGPQRVSRGGPWLAQGPWPLSESPDGRKPRRAAGDGL